MELNPRTDAEALLAHAGWMRALAVSLLGDRAAADDVVQDATLAALLHAPAGDAGLEPWLSRVVRNLASRRRRGEARRADRETRATQPLPEPSPAETLERLDLQRALLDAVRAVEEPLRTTLVLRYFEGKSSAEIARSQRVPAGTVRWRLKRGLDELRERLDARFGSRGSWVALFAPLAGPPTVAPTGGGSAVTSSKILTGVLALKVAQLAATAVAVVVVGGVAWWSFKSSREQAEVGAAAIAQKPVAAQATVDADSLTVAARDRPADASASRASVASEASPAPPPQAAQPDERVAYVDARFVDEHGAPWSGVRFVPREVRWLRNWKPGEGVLSDADGRAAMRIVLPAARAGKAAPGEVKIDFVASHTGCATTRCAATLRAGETAHLGDVVLGPGVSLHGRVIDEHGSGVALATIGVAPAELSEHEGRMRRHGSKSFSDIPSARSTADGTFVLEGVAPGAMRMWAHAEGTRYSWSAPIQMPSDRDVLGIEIVLTTLLATDRIAGRIVGPSDEPIAPASLTYFERSPAGGHATSTPVDGQGRFGLLVEYEDSTYDFTAQDGHERFATATVEGVAPGSLDVVIRLHEKRWLAFLVRSMEGGPISDARFNITARGFGHEEKATSAVPGDYSIAAPDGAFDLTVEAPGFRSRRLPSLDAATQSTPLEVVLQRAPVVRGRVIAGGVPVAGARVHMAGDDTDATGTVAGYRVRYWISRINEGTTSDAEGRFQLDCDEDHGFWLRATADGWAPGEVGPLDAAQLGAELEVDIELTQGGAIEGHVLLPDGRDGEGTIFAINHGDALPRTLRAGPKGFFRVEGLAPGKWQVLPAQSEIDPSSTTYASVETDEPIEWSCEVSAGRTTRYDLDLSKP